MDAHALYRVASKHPTLLAAFHEHADNMGLEVRKAIGVLKDKPGDSRQGRIVLQWNLVAPMTGAKTPVRAEMRVNLRRTLEQRILDIANPYPVTVTLPQGTKVDTVDVGGESFTFNLAEFEGRDVIFKRMPDHIVGQVAPVIQVNVPEQPAPIVNVTIEDAGSVSHSEVHFARNPRTGQLEGATIDGYDQPAA